MKPLIEIDKSLLKIYIPNNEIEIVKQIEEFTSSHVKHLG